VKHLIGAITLSSALLAQITNYTALDGCFYYHNQEYKLLRAFKQNAKDYLLVANTSTLQTFKVAKFPYKKELCSNSKYQYLLDKSTQAPYPLHNDGIIANPSGVTLTTDLCPSTKKGFEKGLYETLFKTFPQPVPVTIFITKRWIQKHYKEFKELQKWEKEKKLAITWGNHSAYHHYRFHVPDSKNYVLSPKENFKKDVFDLEKILLENGITPSVFFRFPGLVSNKKRVEELKALGLIAIGANSWLAIGQKLKDDSIILLHGNKNEPAGIKLFFKLLQEQKIHELRPLLE